MTGLAEWFSGAVAGRRVLQVHNLAAANLASGVEAAARAGASAVSLMDPTPAAAPAWSAARARVAAAGGAELECLSWGLHDRRDENFHAPRRWDVVCNANLLFHQEDPYRWVRRLAELAGERILLGTARLPEIPGLIREGDMVNAMGDDPRLPEIRRQLEARGVRLPQFERLGRPTPWGGRYVGAMWCWFLTAGAVEDMLRDNGFAAEARFPEWGDLAVTIAARRVG